jgi:hypothetical protein
MLNMKTCLGATLISSETPRQTANYCKIVDGAYIKTRVPNEQQLQIPENIC